MGIVARSSRGALAGIVGTAALFALEPLERRVVGRTPVYAPSAIARSLARAYGNKHLGRRTSRRWGGVMRWLYGSSLGKIYGLVRPELPRSRVASPLIFAAAIAGGELLGLPAVHATPRARRWSMRERVMLYAHTIAFALVADAVLRRLTSRRAAKSVASQTGAEPERVETVGPGRACFSCGRAAAWRIAIAGEDEPLDEEDACDAHARGHLRMARFVVATAE